MRVSQIMIKSVKAIQPDTPVEAARDQMSAEDIRHLPVVDTDGRLVGMLSDRDLLRARASDPSPRLVSEIMAKHVHTIAPEALASEAAHAMLDFKIDAVAVVAKGQLVGIVTTTDFLSLACRLLEREK
jgi:CBS domain-containing membrane protein